jgi:TnpA family transposase
LKDRTTPAHVVLDRLAAGSPSDRLAKPLTMLGRIVKTIYVLRYLHDGALRDRVHLQLNRGESRHPERSPVLREPERVPDGRPRGDDEQGDRAVAAVERG